MKSRADSPRIRHERFEIVRPVPYSTRRVRATTGGIIERKTKTGVWTFTLRWQVDGKRRQKVVARHRNKATGRKMAEAAAEKMRFLWDTEQYQEALTVYRRWDEAVPEFLKWCRAHLEASSARRYKNVMRNWQAANLHPELLVDTTGESLEQYKAGLLEEGRAPSGINFEIATLRRFWNWCRQAPRRWVRHDPFEGVAPLRTERGPDTAPRIFTPNECERIRQIAPPTVANLFDFALDTGLRVGEIMYLDPDDIDLENNTVQVVAKPGHRIKDHSMRVVPLSSRAWSIAAACIEERPKGPLFLGDKSPGKRWSKAAAVASYWIKKVAPDASIKVCRATFISYALRDTADLMTVMQWAGHANIETTMRYLSAVPRSHKDAIDAVRFP